MQQKINPENLVVIDIETVPAVSSIHELSEELKDLYLEKSKRLVSENESEEEKFFDHAGIYAEFGKIVCIGVGVFSKKKKDKPVEFRVKDFSGVDEKEILSGFFGLLNKHYKDPNRYTFAGHNIKEFDIPFICRRALLNRMKLPALLDISGRKPYELNFVDTLYQWRFGDFKHYSSLKLLAAIFGIESPKDDIDGKDVGRVFWKENNIERIATYCKKDVVTVAQILRCFQSETLLKKEEIVFVS